VLVFTIFHYMAIFRCVGYFYFHMLEGFCFAFFLPFFTWSHCTFPFVFFLLFFFVIFVVSFRVCLSACKKTTKITKDNREKQHKWKSAVCDHVKKRPIKQRSRILQAY
jgi:uncharacterized membrane protein